MILQSGRRAASRITGIIAEKYQVHRYTVDLTVKTISRVDPIGRLDFGGGEYKAAGRLPIDPARLDPYDRYEWWDLARGCYFVEFNETLELAEDEMAYLEPDDRLLRTGGSHDVAFLRGRLTNLDVLLLIHAARLQIKRNARISHIRLFRLLSAESGEVRSAGE